MVIFCEKSWKERGRCMYDIAIIGGGIAGLTAAIYGQRAGKSTVVLSRNCHHQRERTYGAAFGAGDGPGSGYGAGGSAGNRKATTICGTRPR